MSNFSQFFGGGGGFDMSTHAASGFAKPSIILFDTRAGTRDFVVPEGVTKIRAAVVGAGGNGNTDSAGAGGGYSEKEYTVSGGQVISYTVGAFPSGTSSFDGAAGTITATGGGTGAGSSGGSGSGGDVNKNGGDVVSSRTGGASSGNRYANGIPATDSGGAGWGEDTGGNEGGGSNGIDGFGLGLIPGHRKPLNVENAEQGTDMSGYGCGASAGTFSGSNGGIGGGGGGDSDQGALNGNGGIGGGAGAGGLGGFGLVLVEVLEAE